MSYLLLQMLLYMLGAFLLGLLLGWIIWGRLSVRLAAVEADAAALRAERDRLKADLDACGRARADLEGKLAERDRLQAALDACGEARADLERRLAAGKSASPAPLATGSETTTGSGSAPAPLMSSPAKPAAPAVPTKPDDLRELIGVGPANERLLNEQGVTTFAQIAAWTPDDVKRIEEVLAFDGRIERERWIEQAKYLAAGDVAGFEKAFPNAAKDTNT